MNGKDWQISPELASATEAAVRAGAEENARRRENTDAPRPAGYVERVMEDLWRDQHDALFDKNLRALESHIAESGWYPVEDDYEATAEAGKACSILGVDPETGDEVKLGFWLAKVRAWERGRALTRVEFTEAHRARIESAVRAGAQFFLAKERLAGKTDRPEQFVDRLVHDFFADDQREVVHRSFLRTLEAFASETGGYPAVRGAAQDPETGRDINVGNHLADRRREQRLTAPPEVHRLKRSSGQVPLPLKYEEEINAAYVRGRAAHLGAEVVDPRTGALRLPSGELYDVDLADFWFPTASNKCWCGPMIHALTADECVAGTIMIPRDWWPHRAADWHDLRALGLIGALAHALADEAISLYVLTHTCGPLAR